MSEGIGVVVHTCPCTFAEQTCAGDAAGLGLEAYRKSEMAGPLA